jgi:hypothetical protein
MDTIGEYTLYDDVNGALFAGIVFYPADGHEDMRRRCIPGACYNA